MPERIVYVLYRFITAGKFHGDFPAVFSFSCITDVKKLFMSLFYSLYT